LSGGTGFQPVKEALRLNGYLNIPSVQ